MIDLVKFDKIIIANWKLNGSIPFAKQYFQNILFEKSKYTDKCVIICPPINLITYIDNSKFYSGSQDCSRFNEGAYTGEISSKMLKDLGCDFTIVGHSERRIFFNDNEEIILNKIENCIKNKINPIFCIGENLEQRKENLTKDILKNQIIKSLPKNVKLNEIIIAYEPVWSIGTGIVPNTDEIDEIHNFIKLNIFKDINIKVIYGGSVKAVNYKKILDLKNVDGLLVGGASINLDEFNHILKF